jgi:hypothetical protein
MGARIALQLLLVSGAGGAGWWLANEGELGWPGLKALAEPETPPRLTLTDTAAQSTLKKDLEPEKKKELEALLDEARWQIYAGQGAEAQATLKKAKEIDDGGPEMERLMGKAHRAQGNHSMAARLLKNFITRVPNAAEREALEAYVKNAEKR